MVKIILKFYQLYLKLFKNRY